VIVYGKHGHTGIKGNRQVVKFEGDCVFGVQELIPNAPRHEARGERCARVNIKPGEVYNVRSKSRSDSRPRVRQNGVSKTCGGGSRPGIRQRPGKQAMGRWMVSCYKDEAVSRRHDRKSVGVLCAAILVRNNWLHLFRYIITKLQWIKSSQLGVS
jgi:hypothetical protein